MPPRNSVADAADILTAKRMFFGGLFLFLPFLWLVNLCYFRRALFDRDAPPALTRYLRRSALGALLYTLILAAWIISWQVGWSRWPALEALSVWSAPAQWWLV